MREAFKYALLLFVPVFLVMWACVPPGLQDPSSHFPLRGAHTDVPCNECHIDSLTDADSACASCHEVDRPNRADHNQTDDCGLCHDEEDWACGVNGGHDFLPLTNSHDLLCQDCHEAGCPIIAPTGLQSACSSCHLQDAPANHFGNQCGECHNNRSWSDATHKHETFIVPHFGQKKCDSCHLGDTSTYSCTSANGCHEHDDRIDLNDEHDDEPAYNYNDSTTCTRAGCHPDGREPDD